MKTTTKEPERKEGMKIFVVDDNQLFLMTLVRSLTEKLNCDVKGFTSAEELLEKVGERPSLIISDYYLDSGDRKNMNGDSLLNKLKKNNSDIPVVVYSGQPSVDLAAKSLELGAKDFIPKDNDGFKNITLTTGEILKRLKKEYELKVERNAIIGISSLIVLFVAATFLISALKPDYLFPFFISMLSLAIIVSVINFFLPDIRKRLHLNNIKSA